MRVIYFLVDASADSNFVNVNSFLNFLYYDIFDNVMRHLPEGEKVKYKFICYNLKKEHMNWEITLPDDYHRNLVWLEKTDCLGDSSLGAAFRLLINDFLHHENAVGVFPAVFMLVNYKTNTVAPKFESVLHELLSSDEQGIDKLKNASRIVINIDYAYRNRIFGLKDITILGRLEESVQHYCSQTPFYDFWDYRDDSFVNKNLVKTINFLSIPSDANTRPDWDDFTPASQQTGVPVRDKEIVMGERVSLSGDSREINRDAQGVIHHQDSAIGIDSNNELSLDDRGIIGPNVQDNVHNQRNATEIGQESDGDTEIDESELLHINTEICIEKIGYEQRVALALQLLNGLNGEKSLIHLLKKRKFYNSFPFINRFKYKDIPSFISKNDNYIIAYLVFYIVSGGKYPQDAWGDAIVDYDKTSIGKLESVASSTKSAIEDVCGRRVASDFERKFDATLLEQKRKNVLEAMGNLCGVGSTKIFELLWVIFAKQFEYYDLAFWIKTLQEFYDKKYVVREESHKICDDHIELFNVSYEGRLNKPGHNGCEDYSYVEKFDDNIWLVVVADGVGSCINSALGSKTIAICLSDCLRKYLTDHRLIKNAKRIWGTSTPDARDYAELMYYIEFSLAKDLYKRWEETIKRSPDYQSATKENMSEFATTLQFAFGCAKFIACGVLGDGSFYIKKKVRDGASTCGGFVLNDGLSGVLRHEVLTVPHLKNNPKALQISFYNYDDISDIFISSDGVTNAIGETVESADKFVANISLFPFDERCRALEQLSQKCSDCNETNFGSGDDSSIAYVHIKS